MKKLTVAISAVAASVLMAMSAQAAEIYNKDSNKLDLYGKVNAKHYFSSNDADDGDTTYVRLGFKGETQINDQLTGFGQWEYEFKGNRAESQGSSKDKTRVEYAVFIFQNKNRCCCSFIKYFYSLDAFLSSLGVILKRLWNLSVKREGHL